MAEATRYHLLPEDNRPSMDSDAAPDERLLGPLDSNPSATKNRSKGFNFSSHPTFYIRLIVLALLISGLILFLVGGRYQSIAAIVFICVSITRNAIVLSRHTIGRFLRIHIEIIRTSPPAALPSRRQTNWLKVRRVQVAIDLLIVLALVITTIIAYEGHHNYWYSRSSLNTPACIACWVAIPLHALSTVDMGNPSRITITGGIAADLSRETSGDERVVLQPGVYRDVEVSASGGARGKDRR